MSARFERVERRENCVRVVREESFYSEPSPISLTRTPPNLAAIFHSLVLRIVYVRLTSFAPALSLKLASLTRISMSLWKIIQCSCIRCRRYIIFYCIYVACRRARNAATTCKRFFWNLSSFFIKILIHNRDWKFSRVSQWFFFKL